MTGNLIEAFENGVVRTDGFHHRDHVHLVWAYLRTMPLLEALRRFTEALRRFAARAGKPGLYHETITFAYVILVNERMQRTPGVSWDEFCRLHPDLLSWHPSILECDYRPETLGSELARRVFLLPDRVGSGSPPRTVGCDTIGSPGRA